jgi:predicted methyltransferase
MNRRHFGLAGSALASGVLAAIMLSGCVVIESSGGERVVVQAPAAMAAEAPDAYASVVSDPSRPAADVERDALRHPADILAFARVSPGNRIADVRPGGGYFTTLFSLAVGSSGHVYGFIPNRTAERDNVTFAPVDERLTNASKVNGDLDAASFAFGEPLDVVFMSQEYHDFTIPRFGVDVDRMNARVFDVLKPGGLYILIDHQAAPGMGVSVAGTLHRIEGEALRKQVEAAGFVFEGESPVLRNPADDHSINVFDAAIRGRTDQFVYRFRKPG